MRFLILGMVTRDGDILGMVTHNVDGRLDGDFHGVVTWALLGLVVVIHGVMDHAVWRRAGIQCRKVGDIWDIL
jgi:hypothetical protein